MLSIALFFITLLSLIAIIKVVTDNRYLLPKDKLRLILIALIPIFGALYTLSKVGFSWLNIFANLAEATSKPLQAKSIFAFLIGRNLGSSIDSDD